MNQLTSEPLSGTLQEPMRANRLVAAAWERFVSTGEFGLQLPRQPIAESWQRCRAIGIRPDANRAPTQMEPETIEQVLRSVRFGVLGRETLKGYEAFLNGSGHVVVLADATGNILYVAGQRGTRDALEKINFMPGGIWAEDIVGPNGIGTPLREGKPDVVLGTEHYCQGWQPWVCYGSPIRDPEAGNILGVVDITGPVRHAHVETLGLTVAIAQAVEHKLQLHELRVRDDLHNRFVDRQQRYASDGLVLLTRSGRILDINSAALNVFRVGSAGLRNRRLVELVPEIATSLSGMQYELNQKPFIERDADTIHPGVKLQLEQLRDDDGQTSGYLMVLCRSGTSSSTTSPKSAATAFPQPPLAPAPLNSGQSLREIRDDLIFRTLAECGGEISRAARKLGIARSTLYRRLKARRTPPP